MKKLYLLFTLLFLIVLSSCGGAKKTSIVSTSFAGFDFGRAVAGDLKTSSMLLAPGEELHDYSPSVSDIEKIISSEIFIYIGGESDEQWVEKQILPEIDENKTKVINMMDVVKNGGFTYNEEEPASSFSEEEEEEEEFDEHVWNSITNAKKIINAICDALVEIDKVNEDKYVHNKTNYISKLDKVDSDIKAITNNSNKKKLVFADRFPLLYFVKEYNLEYDAAFKGCETAKEANPKTIESLINVIKENNIKVLFVIELSESNIADTIINTCKKDQIELEKRVFYTMHNLSKDDYEAGKTYVDFMNLNIESLRKALA